MTTVDLAFPILPVDVERDHGYALYGALSRAVPELHEKAWLGVHPLSGRLLPGDKLRIGRGGALRLRLPTEHLAVVVPLAGRTLELQGRPLVLGQPTVHLLEPTPSLDARLVVVKLTDVPRQGAEAGQGGLDRFAMETRVRDELSRQLKALGIEATPELKGHGRIQVAGRRIVGFTVRVAGLSPEASVKLQAHGLGGKRRMGCGVFRPTRGSG